MKEVIVSQFTALVIKAVGKFAKAYHEEKIENIQIVFALDDTGANRYLVCKRLEPIEAVKFNQLLGVKIDFTGKSNYVPPFVNDLLTALNEHYNMQSNSARIFCLKKDHKEEIRLCVYNKDTYVKDLSFDEIFPND